MRTPIYFKALLMMCLSVYKLYAQQPYSPVLEARQSTDWLVKSIRQKAGIYYTSDRQGIILYNGLSKRTFALKPGFGCIDYKNMSDGRQLLRSIKPEAKIIID